MAKLWCAAAGAAASSALTAKSASLVAIGGGSFQLRLPAFRSGFRAEIGARQVFVVLQDAVAFVDVGLVHAHEPLGRFPLAVPHARVGHGIGDLHRLALVEQA